MTPSQQKATPVVVAGIRRARVVGIAVAFVGIAAMFDLGVRPLPTASARPAVITLSYAGDSATAQPDSWLHQLDDPTIDVVGGFAESGDTSTQILSAVSPMKADVLVVMFGANNFRFAASSSTDLVISDINRVVATVGAKHQVISAVPPCSFSTWPSAAGDSQDIMKQLDRAIQLDAKAHGWTFVDPYAAIRDTATNGYSNPFYTADGIHPSSVGYGIAAVALTRAIHIASAGIESR
jgi:lysophospholipase L1-like esterase